MIFSWNAWNVEHIGSHDVSPREAEGVVRGAKPPFPRRIGEDKFLVWGQTPPGRYMQVIFVRLRESEVDPDSLSAEDIAEFLAGGAKVAYVIHARDMTDRQKRQFRRGLK